MKHKNKNTIHINDNTKSTNAKEERRKTPSTHDNVIERKKTTEDAQECKKKHQTRIKKWTPYNKALVARGEVIEIARIAIRRTKLEKKRRKVGHPQEYSDAVIMAMATYREMFNLTLREAAGLAKDVFSIFEVATPSYATLQRRMGRLDISLHIDRRRLRGGIIGLVDSTGFKIAGEGEWKTKKHGAGKRRTWGKVHYLIDFLSLQILAVLLTGDYYADGLAVEPLLKQLPTPEKLQSVIGDGAYGTRALYKLIEKDYGATLISPPWKNAKLNNLKNWETRNRYVKECQEMGRDAWKDKIGYHKRSLVETNMFRIKTAFTDKLKSKTIRNQRVEIMIRTSLLNQWTNKYMPKYT